jgi:hypothetical protein
MDNLQGEDGEMMWAAADEWMVFKLFSQYS